MKTSSALVKTLGVLVCSCAAALGAAGCAGPTALEFDEECCVEDDGQTICTVLYIEQARDLVPARPDDGFVPASGGLLAPEREPFLVEDRPLETFGDVEPFLVEDRPLETFGDVEPLLVEDRTSETFGDLEPFPVEDRPLETFGDVEPLPHENDLTNSEDKTSNLPDDDDGADNLICPRQFIDAKDVEQCLVEIVPLEQPTGMAAVECVYEPCANLVGDEW